RAPLALGVAAERRHLAVEQGAGHARPHVACPRAGATVCSRGVTHDEAHALLGSYAAGTLDDEASEGVRAHLTAGCFDCLREVFGRPVGPPREAVPIPPPPPAVARTRAWVGPIAAVVVLGLALGALDWWTITDLRGRMAAAHAHARGLGARLGDA